jgi:small-conductance mechanosensitive channel/CRP-like cAMP-binding protein
MIFLPAILLALLIAVRFWGAAILAQHFSPPDILALHRALAVAAVIVTAILVDGLVRHFYWHRYWQRRRGRETPALIKDLLTVALVILGVSLGLWWQEGLSFTGLITASGATAVILGIALQTVIQDLFAGLSINLDGSYALGDWLTIYSEHLHEPVYGRVTAITWRSTFLTLEDGRRLMVPNHLATANPVLNHSRPQTAKRYHVEISTDNRVPAGRTMEMLLGEAMKVVREPGMASTPEPFVRIDRTSADAVFFHVCFYAWPDILLPSQANSRMLAALLRVAQHNTVPMPVTQIEVTQPPDLSFALGEEAIRAGVAHVQLFTDTLSEEELTTLAKSCGVTNFRQGAVLMEQGDTTSSMFIILTGAACVRVHSNSGAQEEVAVLAGGDFVGEISLLTGAQRSATVTALTALRALEVKKHDIALLLEKNPGLLQSFSQTLATRQAGLAAAANRVAPASASATNLLARMREFFQHTLGS